MLYVVGLCPTTMNTDDPGANPGCCDDTTTAELMTTPADTLTMPHTEYTASSMMHAVTGQHGIAVSAVSISVPTSAQCGQDVSPGHGISVVVTSVTVASHGSTYVTSWQHVS